MRFDQEYDRPGQVERRGGPVGRSIGYLGIWIGLLSSGNVLDAAFDAFKEGSLIMSGSEESARAAQKARYEQGWGDLETGIKWTFDQGFQWEQVRASIGKCMLRQVEDTGIFIMEDQPKVLDALLRDFVNRARTAK